MVDVINPSITAGIGTQQQVNPLAMLGQYAQTQNALNQNQLFQQTFKAKQAMGQIAQQSVGADGQMDWNKYATLISTHPDTAYIAPDVLNSISQRKLVDADTTNAELGAAKSRMDIWGGVLSAAAKDPDVKNISDMSPYLSQAMSLGGIKNPKDAIAFMADPKIAQLQGPDFKQMLLSHALAMQHGSSALTALNENYKDDAFHDQNGNPVPGWTNPYRQSAVPASSGVAQQLSAGPTGGAPAVNGLQSGQQGAAGAAAPANQLTGAPAAPAVQPNAPTLGKVGPLQSGQLAEIPEYQKDVDSRQSSAQALLLQMQQAQRMLKNFTPNGAANVRAELGRIANGMGAPKELQDELTNGSIDNTQAAQKTLFGIGSQLAAQLIHAGGGRLSQTEWAKTLDIGSPNIDMTPGAISKIMTSMREMAHVTDMERTHLYGRLQQAQNGQYNITNVKNDWAKTLNGYIDAREGQEQ